MSSTADRGVNVGENLMDDPNIRVEATSGSSDPGDITCFPPMVSSVQGSKMEMYH